MPPLRGFLLDSESIFYNTSSLVFRAYIDDENYIKVFRCWCY